MTPWAEIRQDIKLCRKCPLANGREHAVPGEGPPDAQIVIVGEAPGESEDRAGKPFVGRSGEKLDAWLAKAGLTRDEVFVTNLLKCQPPEYKFPEYSAGGPVDQCRPFLHTQLRLLNPLAIVVAGKQALQHLLLAGSAQKVGFVDEWVGKVLRRRDLFGETRLGVVFHPSYILRNKNPTEEEKCVRTLRTIAAYCAARRRGEPAPVVDMTDIRPGTTPTFQTRFRLFPELPVVQQEPPK
jgi:DNA polymerase